MGPADHPRSQRPGSPRQLDKNGVLPYSLRRSSIQVAELKLVDGKLICKRDEDFDFFLPAPENINNQEK